ncbi:sodium:solute symporter family protein [Granulicella paludicola]|uniref:sodium:solute symporter family protein n=1 Tax=Granulicella paludicola TaxID=474951 RepID=UPI0021E0CB30|nr:sodium:solute symporter family protein [Granulicella paludicola]
MNPASLLALFTLSGQLTHLAPVDILILVLYFAVVIFIGFYVKGSTNTSEEFFLAGREMSAWIAGLSFVSANLGSLELMGWAGSAYQYGILAMHWYWIGAIPAMLFLGIVMMPFYYISKTHSVPGYLQLRFGEAARGLSAVSFGLMTILMSGVNMYAMAVVMQTVLGWNMTFSIWVGAATVAVYVMLGGLRSAIINEVLQFILIWAGAALIPILGLIEAGGWTNLKANIAINVGNSSYTHLWSTLGHFQDNPMGINWFGIIFGLGAIVSFGYWTTDFLVVQRVLSANNLRAAKMAPVIGAAFKMAVPLIVILPGLICLGLMQDGHPLFHLVPADIAKGNPALHSYDQVLPLMLIRYCGPGLLGLGITALVAGFMSGMAGNVSAFSTVWTYDIYGAYIKKNAPDRHYVAMGRWSTVVGMLVSIATAYLVMNAASIMDYVQALFSFFIAPLFGTVILGMLWKRATGTGGFLGLLAGTVSSISMFIYTSTGTAAHKAQALAHIALSPYAQPQAENMFRALWSWLICVFVTVIVSYMTKPKTDAELDGLVYGATVIPHDGSVGLFQKPVFWACVVAVVFIGLNLLFF